MNFYRHVVVMESQKIDELFESIITALEGDFDKPVSSFPAFGRVLQYLKSNRIDGWIYRRGHDGNLYPVLLQQ
jgi:hypothetical protein